MQRWLGLELHRCKNYLRITASSPFQCDGYRPSSTFEETFPLPVYFFQPEDENYTRLGETFQLNEANEAEKRGIMHYLA